MSRRLLITGVGGFIGARVARLALDQGYDVTGLTRGPQTPRRLADVDRHLRLMDADLIVNERWRSVIRESRPDACLHLAWCAEPGKYLTDPANVDHLASGIGLLQELYKNECARVVMIGTCAEYDTSIGFLREETPTRPVHLYSACKLAMGTIGAQIATLAARDFAWARIFYVYGPGEDERRLVPAALRALSRGEDFAATSGEQVRDYLHVDDIAAALLAIVASKHTGPINVSSGDPVTIRALLSTLQDVVGGRARVLFGKLTPPAAEPPFVCGDASRLRALGWRPRYSLRDGLTQTRDALQAAAAS